MGISRRAIEHLRRIQYHQVHPGGERRDGTSSLSDADHAILQGLKLPKPTIGDQLAFLYGHVSTSNLTMARTYEPNCRTLVPRTHNLPPARASWPIHWVS